MEKINELFECTIGDAINQTYPSLYTKDDVVSLLSKLRTTVLYEVSELKPSAGTYYDVNAINRAIADIIDNIDFEEYITSEPDLCGSYGSSFTLELNTSFDAYQFSRQMECELTDYFKDLNTETNEG
jgi:hypothetical protein